MSSRKRWAIGVAGAALGACALAGLWSSGCGLQHVQLDSTGLVPLSAENAPVRVNEDGTSTITVATGVTGSTCTFPYDPLMWRVARFPIIESSDGIPVLLDTGHAPAARVTIDTAREAALPVHLEENINFAYAPQIRIGPLVVSDLLAMVDLRQWQFRVLGIPLYRMRGWTLGSPVLLTQTRYLAFDNPARQVTFGFENFEPSHEAHWRQYDLTLDSSARRPFVRVPIAGIELELLLDSAGGPRLILNPEQWEQIASSAVVLSRRRTSYPAWGGFQEVDEYAVKSLDIAGLGSTNSRVWVRRAPILDNAPPLLGLGPLAKAIVVFDVAGGKFWLGTPR